MIVFQLAEKSQGNERVVVMISANTERQQVNERKKNCWDIKNCSESQKANQTKTNITVVAKMARKLSIRQEWMPYILKKSLYLKVLAVLEIKELIDAQKKQKKIVSIKVKDIYLSICTFN